MIILKKSKVVKKQRGVLNIKSKKKTQLYQIVIVYFTRLNTKVKKDFVNLGTNFYNTKKKETISLSNLKMVNKSNAIPSKDVSIRHRRLCNKGSKRASWGCD